MPLLVNGITALEVPISSTGTDVVKDALEDIEFDSAAVREELGDMA